MNFLYRPVRVASFVLLGLTAACSSGGSDIDTQASSSNQNQSTRNRQAPVPTPPAQQRVARTTERTALGAEELRTALAGNSVYVGNPGSEFAAVHNNDGSMAGRSWGSGNDESGEGEWRVDDNGQYCRKWSNGWSAGQWGCFEVYRDGENLQLERVSGAGANGAMELKDGNPHDL